MHMDVKPDNIYTTSGGTYKLGDFGLATCRGSSGHAQLQEGDSRLVALLKCSVPPTPLACNFGKGLASSTPYSFGLLVGKGLASSTPYSLGLLLGKGLAGRSLDIATTLAAYGRLMKDMCLLSTYAQSPGRSGCACMLQYSDLR